MTSSIGLIDSGLGGYTIYNALHKALPHVSFTFIADQKRAPIGNKSIDELKVIGFDMVNALVKKDISKIIIACNTLSANVLEYLEKTFPEVTFYSVIDCTIASLKPKHKKIIILATKSTIDSHAYQIAITKQLPVAWVDEVAAPHLVDLIEGLAEDVDIDEMLEDLLSSRNKVNAIVMGCTHYPIIAKNIQKFCTGEIISSLDPIVKKFKEMDDLPMGPSKVYTTYDGARMAHQIRVLFKQEELVEVINFE